MEKHRNLPLFLIYLLNCFVICTRKKWVWYCLALLFSRGIAWFQQRCLRTLYLCFTWPRFIRGFVNSCSASHIVTCLRRKGKPLNISTLYGPSIPNSVYFPSLVFPHISGKLHFYIFCRTHCLKAAILGHFLVNLFVIY